MLSFIFSLDRVASDQPTGRTAVSPWPVLCRYVFPLRATVQMHYRNMMDCLLLRCMLIFAPQPLLRPQSHRHSNTCTVTHKHTQSWTSRPRGLSRWSSPFAQRLGRTSSHGWTCVTQVAVVQRFIPPQCRCVGDVLRSIQWNATVKAPLCNSMPSFLHQTWAVLQLFFYFQSRLSHTHPTVRTNSKPLPNNTGTVWGLKNKETHCTDSSRVWHLASDIKQLTRIKSKACACSA